MTGTEFKKRTIDLFGKKDHVQELMKRTDADRSTVYRWFSREKVPKLAVIALECWAKHKP